MSQNYLEISYLKGSLIFGVALLLSSCSSTAPLTKTNVSSNQTIQTMHAKVIPASADAILPTALVVDWQKIEALANKMYEDEPLSTDVFHVLEETDSGTASGFYANDFNVSMKEAQRRLILAGISSPLIEAVTEQLGESLAAIYYDNNDPNEFSIKMTTLTTVEAVPPKYVYRFKQKEFKDYSLPIYIQADSDKNEQQILALQQKATPEIRRRYPEMQLIGFTPMTNTIRVMIYRKTPDESERQRIEAELTELVGHPVVVEFIKNRITTL
ncbi:hypothetical protein [Psychrobacter sp.]|uniref:hypothetical protein n=1 Tax=Psychrobacter sp. TaxID=56811 RepID=UPI003BAEE6F1